MSRLIDADELLKHKGNCYDEDGRLLYAVGTGDIINAPTIEAEPVRYGRWLDLDREIAEKNSIMADNEPHRDSDPDALLNYCMARMIKVYLLSKWYAQRGDVLRGEWQTAQGGNERCSVCWTPRRIAEFAGTCVGCGAKMDGGDADAPD